MRPTKIRTIVCRPPCRRFQPLIESEGDDSSNLEMVTIRIDMLEAMRLVDAEGLNQDDAAQSMDISPATLCRILGQGRKLVAMALSTGKAINIDGGNVTCVSKNHTHHGQHGRCSTEEPSNQDVTKGSKGQGKGRCRGHQGKCWNSTKLSSENEAQDES